MFDIVHRIGITSPPASVFAALSTLDGLAGWWSKEVSGHARTGETITFTFRSPSGEIKGSMDMLVREHRDAARVEWQCVSGPAEWIDTRISFALQWEDGQTTVRFAHRGWREEVEFTAHCSMKWAVFLLSLRDYVERGVGQPSPDDVKIDNWN